MKRRASVRRSGGSWWKVEHMGAAGYAFADRMFPTWRRAIEYAIWWVSE